jgi:hypothetical protein
MTKRVKNTTISIYKEVLPDEGLSDEVLPVMRSIQDVELIEIKMLDLSDLNSSVSVNFKTFWV